MRSDRIVVSSSARRAGPSPDSRARAVASASRWAVHSPKRCMSADSPSEYVLVDHISACARSRSGTSSPLSNRSAIRSCSEATAPGASWSSGARAMAEARASSNRPWSSSWSRAAAMSGQARRTTSPPARARLRKYVACRSRVASSRGVSASRRRAKPRTGSGHHEPWLAVGAPVSSSHQVRVEELQQVVSGVAGGRARGPRTAAAASSRNGPSNTDTWSSVRCADFDNRSKLQVRAASRPCLPRERRAIDRQAARWRARAAVS